MISRNVYEAFGLKGNGIKLKGGQNNSFKYGNKVVKEFDGDNENYIVTANILINLNSPHYRITTPIISKNNKYIEDNYIATYYQKGAHDFNRIHQTLELSKIFHNDLKKFDVNLYKQANNQWAIAMDILFRNRKIPKYVNSENKNKCLAMMEELCEIKDELQIIHGDFSGNVLYHDTLSPCIIDFSPNIAPQKISDATTIVDSIAWSNKDFNLLNLLQPYEKYRNYYLHAVMFRILTMLCKKDCTKEEFSEEYNVYIKVWDYIIN